LKLDSLQNIYVIDPHPGLSCFPNSSHYATYTIVPICVADHVGDRGVGSNNKPLDLLAKTTENFRQACSLVESFCKLFERAGEVTVARTPVGGQLIDHLLEISYGYRVSPRPSLRSKIQSF